MASDSYKALTSGLVRAEDHFRDAVRARGFTDDEARAILRFYLRHRLVKLDPIMGRSEVRHGGLLDRAALRRCLETPILKPRRGKA